MTIVDRVRELGLPAGQFVVIGSGVLDALGLRPSGDVDLAVSDTLFDQLKADGWRVTARRDGEVLERGDVEAWHGWGPDADFERLLAGSVMIDEIHFANPQFVIDRKRQRGSAKDLTDIKLLEEYLTRGAA